MKIFKARKKEMMYCGMRLRHKFLLITSLVFGLVVFNACPENSPKPGNSNPASQGPSTYTITYNANKAHSGTAPAKQEKQAGQDLTLAANSGILKRTGYVFKGWNTKADGTGTSYTAGAGYTEDKAITLYAEWWALISYDANKADSGTVPKTQEKQAGQDLTLADNSGILQRTGYKFKGWNTKEDGTGITYQAGTSYVEGKTLTLYANWWPLITYDANGADSGTIPAKQEKQAGKDSIIASNAGNLVKQGEYFAGWNTKADGTGDHYNAGSKYTLDKALTLYVEWASGITLIYDANGADSGTAPVKQEKQLGQVVAISDNSGTLARTGYIFKGWNTQADGKGTSYKVKDSYIKDKTLALYAEWWTKITYDANGADTGTAPQEQEKQLGQVVAISDNSGTLARTGYIFKGWNTQADGKGTSYKVKDSYIKDKTLALYAEWWTKITYDANGADSGTASQEQEKQPGKSLTLANSDTLKRIGYKFKGWNTQADGTGTSYKAGASYTEDKPLTLYAEWWAKITYDGNGSDGIAFLQYEKQPGQDLTLLHSLSSRLNYVFKGWNTQADGTGTSYKAGASYTEDKPLTLYAEWWAEITYDGNGADTGTAPPGQVRQPGQDISIADNSGTLARTGYIFYGWNTQKDLKGTHYDPGAKYSEAHMLYAEWYIPISNVADLERIRVNLNEAYILQNDIDLSSVANFEPIGSEQAPFTGIFDGRGHTISKLTITRKTEESVGFFRCLEGWVYNLQFNQAIVEGKGGFDDPYASFSGVGVLAGSSTRSKVQRVIIQGSEVTATRSFAALLIGNGDADTIEECGVEGKVTAAEQGAGGLFGTGFGIIRRSYAKGEVTSGGGHAGGLVGGGIKWVSIEDCYTDIVVISSDDYIGGLLGWQSAGDIRNSYAVGKVSNTETVTSKIGGLIGWQDNDIINSYFDSSSTGQSNGVGVVAGTATGTPTAYTTSDLTGSDKFLGWDFTGINGKPAIWHWVGTGKWPILQWQYEMQQAP